ncbi:unnamed protein product [Lota lota]
MSSVRRGKDSPPAPDFGHQRRRMWKSSEAEQQEEQEEQVEEEEEEEEPRQMIDIGVLNKNKETTSPPIPP